MKKDAEKEFKLDLSEYTIEVDVPKRGAEGVIVKDEKGAIEVLRESIAYPIRGNISTWLRTAGMFRTVEDVAEAVCLAKHIREAPNDFLILDEKEASILKRVVDRHLELTADGQAQLGGEIHEEAICRVANMEEVE